ncbi:MAG: UvrD-helicase domain-containing protein [Cyclobacteriaceae bacterium]|nr:UvrD-helicase domain-containing protein [Cyclobacteriaceae bacterium]MDW8330550.1 UvrD-helicase domain-containing protein [Cyclobacteriaceae bacterium]
MSVLTIYRSSAGSGKTRTLAKVFIRLALQYRADYFRHILAVTFTNKATQEMKSRIIKYLDEFSRGQENDLTQELCKELGLNESTLREQSNEVLRLILHKYSDFSISTIDAFFQRVIRAFTREAGLAGDYRLIVDVDEVLDEVVNELLDETGQNKQLTRWLIEFTLHALENRQQFDIRIDLKEFAKILLKEEFRQIEKDIVSFSPEQVREVMNKLNKIRYGFINQLKGWALEAINWFDENGLEAEDFKHGQRGSVYSWFRNVAEIKNAADVEDLGKRARADFLHARNWPGKNPVKEERIIQFAETKGIELLQNITSYRDRHFSRALTAEIILENLYLFGLTQDLIRKLSDYRRQHNAMLLAEAPSLLQGIISESETPFIYEKVGSFYRHFLIDEFQDTSGLQWNNLRPLVINSLDQGYESMVVGDVKQAIYRWRGGNLKLLHQEIEKHVGPERVKTEQLGVNYRSGRQIIAFNNAFFQAASEIVKNLTGASISADVFTDVAQRHQRDYDGFVQIEFIPTKGNSSAWKEEAKNKLCALIEQLQHRGIQPRDIAILVRSNREGEEVITHLVNYQYSDKAKPGVRYEVLSNESLRIDSAASVNLLLYAMRYLYNPDDDLARAGLSFEYNRIHTSQPLSRVMQVTNSKNFRDHLPLEFFRQENRLRTLPLYELTETLIGIFDLTRQQGEIAYLQAFQDMVLNFSIREQNELGDFLIWWEEVRETDRAAIKSATESNAMQLLTIHKSKGLQFKYVIIPFCNWKLDQSSEHVMWVRTDKPPFSDPGVLPVKYGSKLKYSFFKDDYETERSSSYLDNLNLLYVAFTRPEKGLFIIAPRQENEKVKTDEGISEVSKLLMQALEQNTALSGSGDLRLWGTLSDETPEPAVQASDGLNRYDTFSWRQRLIIRTAATPDSETLREEGIRLHNILSRLQYADELPDLMERLIQEGALSQEEADKLKQKISSWLEDTLVKSWFDRTWQVRTEVPVLLPGGDHKRIDRLVMRPNQTIVVDFKTGRPDQTADELQVREYMQLLSDMGMRNVKGYVFYTRTGRTSEVKLSARAGKNKTDNNQLSLDF